MPKSRKPCSAIQRCSLSENRRRRPFMQAQDRRIRPARVNRYTTDTTGGTVPNWKVMASQVDPQMRTEVRYKPRLLIGQTRRERSGCCGEDGARGGQGLLHLSLADIEVG